nr:hypothetical protein [Tanacetum cinerariifolium]
MQSTILNVHPASSALILDLQHQLYTKIKFDPQSQAVDSDLWNALKTKYAYSYASTNSCRHDAFCKYDHDSHPDDDVLHEGENSAKRQKTSRGSNSSNGSSSKQPTKESNTTSS